MAHLHDFSLITVFKQNAKIVKLKSNNGFKKYNLNNFPLRTHNLLSRVANIKIAQPSVHMNQKKINKYENWVLASEPLELEPAEFPFI